MPLRIECPSCSASITAAERAAGKTVACPKCKALMRIPGAEAVEDEIEIVDDAPARSPSRPPSPSRIEPDDADDVRRRRPTRDDDDDDDDRPRRSSRSRDDEGDRPRSRPRPARRKKSGGFPVLPVVILAGIAFLFVGGGLFIWAMLPRPGERGPRIFSNSTSNPASVSWTKFDSPDGSFSAEFPNGPPTAEAGTAGNGFVPMGNNTGMEAKVWNRTEANRAYMVGYFTMPAELASQMSVDQMMGTAKPGQIQNGMELTAVERTTLDGQPAIRLVGKQKGHTLDIRMVKVKGHLFIVGVTCAAALPAGDPIIISFFDRFHVLRVPEPRGLGSPSSPLAPRPNAPNRGPDESDPGGGRPGPFAPGPGPGIPGPVFPGRPGPIGPGPIVPKMPIRPGRPGGENGRP